MCAILNRILFNATIQMERQDKLGNFLAYFIEPLSNQIG